MTKQQNKLVTDHHYLIAQCMKICKIPLKYRDDYYGDAAIGLCEAVVKFDESNGTILNFTQYARTIVINKIKMVYRKELSKKRDIIKVGLSGAQNKKDESFENNFNFRLIFLDLSQLLYMKEQIIVKMILEGYTYAEIGNELGMSGQAIHKKIKKIRRRLTSTTDLARCGV